MNENKEQIGPAKDRRSQPRWSGNKKMDTVLRLLRGEPLDQLSPEPGFTEVIGPALFAVWRHHAFVTNRAGDAVTLDVEHRAHAVVELAIRDLKHGTGLNHCPSGSFNTNAAWLLATTLAHNLTRWTQVLGTPNTPRIANADPPWV